MNFKLKAAIQWCISCLPHSTRINRLMQLHVTKSLPISDSELNARIEIVNRHLKSYFDLNGVLPEKVLDIGSGSDLSLPLLMTKQVNTVIASDINRLANNYLINNIVNRIGLPSFVESGLEYVVYEPPIMPFNNESFDLITSTSVLEHVPKFQVPVLAKEIYRLLKKDGVSSHHIAHKDHWSDADKKIPPMNYLRYGEKAWRKYNPPLLHQNRLLSSDFTSIFHSVGFNVQTILTKVALPDFEISDYFKNYGLEDLSTTHTWLILTKEEGND